MKGSTDSFSYSLLKGMYRSVAQEKGGGGLFLWYNMRSYFYMPIGMRDVIGPLIDLLQPLSCLAFSFYALLVLAKILPRLLIFDNCENWEFISQVLDSIPPAADMALTPNHNGRR